MYLMYFEKEVFLSILANATQGSGCKFGVSLLNYRVKFNMMDFWSFGREEYHPHF